MRLYQKFAMAWLAASVAGHTATAQALPSHAAPSPAATSPAAPLHLSVVVNGGAPGNLQPADVTLLDNGSPVPIQSLHPLRPSGQASGAPAHVILVIDDVNAGVSTIAYERDQLKKFFLKNDGQLPVPFTIAVMTDTKLDIQPGFSQRGADENAALQQYKIGLHELRRDSQYGGFDRADLGIRGLTQLVQYAGTIPGHKLILFVSPGWPLLSGPRVQLSRKEQDSIFNTVAGLQDSMLRADVTIDMLNPIGPAESVLRSDYYESFEKGVSKPGNTDIADLSLQVLTVHSGGTIQQGSSDITGMVDRAVGDLDRLYTLTFTPSPAEGTTTYHSLKLQLNRPGVTVTMPDEYYAQTPASTDVPR